MMGMNAKCMPRMLKDEEMAARVFQGIITAEETWVYVYDHESKMLASQWKQSGSPHSNTARISRPIRKHMFIVYFNKKGEVLCQTVSKGQSIDTEY